MVISIAIFIAIVLRPCNLHGCGLHVQLLKLLQLIASNELHEDHRSTRRPLYNKYDSLNPAVINHDTQAMQITSMHHIHILGHTIHNILCKNKLGENRMLSCDQKGTYNNLGGFVRRPQFSLGFMMIHAIWSWFHRCRVLSLVYAVSPDGDSSR